MSRSSRAILLGVGLLVVAGTLAAQQIPATAILETGPESRRGIDALAPDVTPHWYGRYAVAAADVEVIYIAHPLSAAASWPIAPCDERVLRAAGGPVAGGLTYHENSAGWSLLVRIAGGDLPPGITLCDFVDRFIERHRLFEGLEKVTIPGSAPVFPAIIEL